jgi:hypothetical protein
MNGCTRAVRDVGAALEIFAGLRAQRCSRFHAMSEVGEKIRDRRD